MRKPIQEKFTTEWILIMKQQSGLSLELYPMQVVEVYLVVVVMVQLQTLCNISQYPLQVMLLTLVT